MKNLEDSNELVKSHLENVLLTVNQQLKEKQIKEDIFLNHSSIDIKVSKKYGAFGNNGLYYNEIQKSDLPREYRTDIPFPIFGLNDFQNGFRNLKQNNPSWGFEFMTMGIVGKDELIVNYNWVSNFGGKPISNVNSGDLVLIFQSRANLDESILGGHILYTCEIVVSVNQGGYGALLNALNQKSLPVSGIRLKVAEGKESQFDNDFKIFRQDIFGKISNDSFTPSSFKQTSNYLPNIIDIPLQTVVDANLLLTNTMNFDLDEMLINISSPELVKK